MRCRTVSIATFAITLIVCFGIFTQQNFLSNYVAVVQHQFEGGVTNDERMKVMATIDESQSRNELVCGKNATGYMKEWYTLCSWGLVQALEEAINDHDNVHIVQIGAHVGFEANDPIDKGLAAYLHQLPSNIRQSKVHWTFVEPSPPNFDRLMQNLANHSDLCDLTGIRAGVVPDSMNATSSMTFYSISESIDPETGYDSKSGKSLPKYITQVSSFSLGPIMFNARQFKRRGLNVSDYIVETNVTTKRYSELLREVIAKDDDVKTSNAVTREPPVLVLIDTEGFDCKIVLGISSDSAYLPRYLIYEINRCGPNLRKKTEAYLRSLGYVLASMGQNTLAFRKNTTTTAHQGQSAY